MRLNITAAQREEWFPQLGDFLKAHPLELTEWLYGRNNEKRQNGQEKWKKGDVRDAEKLILSKFGPREHQGSFYQFWSAGIWSVTARTKPKLPRILVHVEPVDNPFRFDYARAAADYDSWKNQLKTWIRTLKIREQERSQSAPASLCLLCVCCSVWGCFRSRLSRCNRPIDCNERAVDVCNWWTNLYRVLPHSEGCRRGGKTCLAARPAQRSALE